MNTKTFIAILLNSVGLMGQTVVVSTNGEKLSLPSNANQIVNSPTGNIAATNVQTALYELDSEKAPALDPQFKITVNNGFSVTSTIPVGTLMSLLQQNQPTNTASYFKLGRTEANRDVGYMYFNYAGTNSNNNSLNFSFNNVLQPVISIDGQGKAYYNANEIATKKTITENLTPPFSRQMGSLTNITTSTAAGTIVNVILPQFWIDNGWNLTNTPFAIRVKTYGSPNADYNNMLTIVDGGHSYQSSFFIVNGKVMRGSNTAGFLKIFLQFEINGPTQLTFKGIKLAQISGTITSLNRCEVYIQY